MRIFVLSDDCASSNYFAEHGLSFYIEYNDKKILFDTGHSDIFLKNAKLLNVNLDNVQNVVLSHGHWDHCNGLEFIKDKRLISHPDIFTKRYSKLNKNYLGIDASYEDLKNRFQFLLIKDPYYIYEDFIFLGEIPRLNDFESRKTNYFKNNGDDDFIIDDSALAIIKDNSLIIVTGCSHSGICNIIDYAQKITNIKKIKAVIGGFHLIYDDAQLIKTIDYFKTLDIQSILPCHCTQLPAMARFYNEFKIMQVKTGMVFDF